MLLEWMVVLLLVGAAGYYLARHAWKVIQGVREHRNPSCEGCGVTQCCSTASKGVTSNK